MLGVIVIKISVFSNDLKKKQPLHIPPSPE